jgi:23S rRNA (uridine2552-2'-O)-methyltransferase
MGKTRTGMRYVPKDDSYHKAKKEGFVARSALKLEELDKKHKLFKRGMRILDLGCAPGSWLQYAAKRVGPEGYLFGIDLDPVRIDIKNVTTVQGDIYELKADDERLVAGKPFDFIQSDAMSKTRGIPESDCARSVALVEHGMNLARGGCLKMGGTYLAKVFEGPGFTEFYTEFKKYFAKTSVNRPEATRQGSREVYVLGLEFRERKG